MDVAARVLLQVEKQCRQVRRGLNERVVQRLVVDELADRPVPVVDFRERTVQFRERAVHLGDERRNSRLAQRVAETFHVREDPSCPAACATGR